MVNRHFSVFRPGKSAAATGVSPLLPILADRCAPSTTGAVARGGHVRLCLPSATRGRVRASWAHPTPVAAARQQHAHRDPAACRHAASHGRTLSALSSARKQRARAGGGVHALSPVPAFIRLSFARAFLTHVPISLPLSSGSLVLSGPGGQCVARRSAFRSSVSPVRERRFPPCQSASAAREKCHPPRRKRSDRRANRRVNARQRFDAREVPLLVHSPVTCQT